MSCGRRDTGNRSFAYYILRKHRAHCYKGGECIRRYIQYDVLYTYVLEWIKHWAVRAERDGKSLLEELLQSGKRECAAILRIRPRAEIGGEAQGRVGQYVRQDVRGLPCESHHGKHL